MPNKENFTKELTWLIARYPLDNDSETPDFVLAAFLTCCLENFNAAVVNREHWQEMRNSGADGARSTGATGGVRWAYAKPFTGPR